MKKLFSVLLVVCLTLSVCCLPVSATTLFSDITGNEWYAPAVAYCADNGYMSGTGNNKFDPNGKVSRAQMAQILYNFAGRPDMTNAENPFTDVKRDAWYGSAVLFAKTTGIVNGTSSTTYSPNNYITREQVAVMLMGYYKASTGNTPSVNNSVLNSYTDKNMISSWAQDAIAWAIQNKIMSGVGNNKIDPKGTCTRAQLAQFIMNYCENIGTPAPIEPDIPKPILPDIPGFPEDGNFEPISKDWLPEGGYWQGNRKYNRFGIDITDVDGVPQADEIQLMAMINQYRVENGLPELKWSRYAQVFAEVRTLEEEYIYLSGLYDNKYGTPHVRADGSHYTPLTFNEETTTPMIPGNELMFAEFSNKAEKFGLDIKDMDEQMANSGKIPNTSSFWYGTTGENSGQQVFMHTSLASMMFNAWKNSPGHEAAYKRNYDGTQTGYFAVGMSYSVERDIYTFSYDTFGLEWIVDGEQDYVPGRGIDYNSLGFTLDDIPDEYPDWILRDPDMDLESYGPTDHDINSVTHWLIDHGVEEDSDTMYQVKAHYFSTLSMDDYIKFMFSNTEVFHYKNLMPGEWSDITKMIDTDISYMKEILVTGVADKMAYQHMSENNHSDTKCDVCGKNHAEKRDLAAAEQVVNQFFQDTYGFDISAY